jgi:probable rRNA maturation factor
MTRRVRVTVTDAHGRQKSWSGLARWLERAAPARARGAVTVAVVPDAAMKRLNKRFRRTDRTTDVLSFGGPKRPKAQGPRPKAQGPRPEDRLGGPWARGPGPALGDIAIASGVARRQARQQGHSLAIELRILALHGLLHLLGYDHLTDQGQMRRLEERLRRRMGLPVGLIARTPRRARR